MWPQATDTAEQEQEQKEKTMTVYLTTFEIAVSLVALGTIQFFLNKYGRAHESFLVSAYIASIGFFWLVIYAIINA